MTTEQLNKGNEINNAISLLEEAKDKMAEKHLAVICKSFRHVASCEIVQHPTFFSNLPKESFERFDEVISRFIDSEIERLKAELEQI